jgi:hypothetical protein
VKRGDEKRAGTRKENSISGQTIMLMSESVVVNKGKEVVQYRLLVFPALTPERQVEARVVEELAKADVL